MMKLTLITHEPNQVVQRLKELGGVELNIIESFSDSVESECSKAAGGMLITYRCPHLISKEVYEAFELGAYNVHPSLLPAFSGLNPWPRIFEEGVSESGVTLHQLSEEPDGGEIIMQKKFSIDATDTIDTARAKADSTAASLIVDFVSHYIQCTQ